MNNKLKIYARETKNGKEYNLTQLVSVPSPINKTVTQINQPLVRSISKSKQNSRFGSINLRNTNNSEVKNKQIPISPIKMNKSFNCNLVSDINSITHSGIKKNKSKTPVRTRLKSKEKIEVSINIVIELKERITYMNHQIDLLEEEHNNIFSYGEETVSELKQQMNKMIKELNKSKEGSKYYTENNQLQEKKRTNDMLKKQIEEHNINIQCLKDKQLQLISTFEKNYNNVINIVKQSYQQKIMQLDNQIESIGMNNHNDTQLQDNPYLIEHNNIGLLLKILFEIKNVSIEQLIEEILVEDQILSIDVIADKLFNIIGGNNTQNKDILIRFIEVIVNEIHKERSNTGTLKDRLIKLLGNNNRIVINRDELNAQVNQLMYSNCDLLFKKFNNEDINSNGRISINAFNEIMLELKYFDKENEQLYRYIIYIMKENMNPDCIITDLAYDNLLNVLISSSNEIEEQTVLDEDVYICKIYDYLVKNNLNNIDSLIESRDNEIEIYSSREYIDNKVLNKILKEKNIIKPNESIACEKGNKVNLNDITYLKAKLSQF